MLQDDENVVEDSEEPDEEIVMPIEEAVTVPEEDSVPHPPAEVHERKIENFLPSKS